MPISRLALLLALSLLCGCADSAPPSSGINGPTGRARDANNVVTIKVRDVWKQDLKPLSQSIIAKQLRFGSTAHFDPPVDYEAYYDRTNDITRVGVYGNVTSHSDYGTVDNNGYYVTWELPGRIEVDFTPMWKLVDVEVLDSQF